MNKYVLAALATSAVAAVFLALSAAGLSPVQKEAVASTRPIADVSAYQFYKIGKTPTGETMMQAMGVSAVEALPDASDRHTVIVFDEAGDYIYANMDELEFRGKIAESISNHAKVVSVAKDQTAFKEMMRQAAGQNVDTPDTGARLNGKEVLIDRVLAAGYTQRPLDAMCTTHQNPENPDEKAPCPYLPSVFGAEAYLEDGSADPLMLAELLAKWIVDE